MNKFDVAKISAILSIMLLSPSQSMSAENNSIKIIPTASLSWETTDEGVAFAPLLGDRFQEAYMAMVKLPSGTVSPPHTKSSNMFGVVISGTLVHRPVTMSRSEVPELPSGSFYKIPKDLPHVSSCVSKEACVTFLYQDGKFDFITVKQ